MKIRELREAKGMTQGELADRLDIKRAAISQWESGTTQPRHANLVKLAEILGTRPDILIGIIDDEIMGRDIEYVGRLEQGDTIPIPIIGEIKAGPPLLAIREDDGQIDMPRHQVAGGSFFFLRVHGDSMIDEGIRPGSLVLVRQTNVVEPGTMAVVLIDREEATVKFVHWTNGEVILRAANPAYTDVRLRRDQVQIIGTVEEIRTYPRR